MSKVMIELSLQELSDMIATAVSSSFEAQARRSPQLVTKRKAQELLGVGYKKLNTLIGQGFFHLTPQGRIKLLEIENYLSSSSTVEV